MGLIMKFEIPTTIYQEVNAVKNHASELSALGKKALIVTGKNSSKANGSLKDVIDALSDNKTEYVIYNKIEENPSVEQIMVVANIGRTIGIDFVIGIGGGSPMDAAKAIALMIKNTDSSEQVLYQNIPLDALPVAEVPTTCGTGSEVTPFAILTRHDIHTKQSISHRIFPMLALVDPKYLKQAPASVITNTAIDTLGHLLESYFNTKATDYTKMLCMCGMKEWAKIHDAIRGITPNEEACEKLMFASSLGGMAISHTSTALPHGCSYYLTYEKNIPHGKAVGVFLPGYLASLTKEYQPEVIQILKVLGFESMEIFCDFIRQTIGTVELKEEEIRLITNQLLEIKEKLAAVPYTVTETDIFKILTYLN